MFRFGADRRKPPAARDAGREPARAPRVDDERDTALIARVASQDLAAFEALYRAYHPRLERFVGLMTTRRTLVEEVLNDTMLVVWRRAATYNQQCKVSTWVFAIAYRTALKALQRHDEPAADPPDDERVSEGPGPEQRHSALETRAALHGALETLSSEQRSVLVLTYFHDLPYAEIAQIMSCPVDTVKTRVFHARRRLRALLSGELGDWL
jgi:RNA polymerase sigma factor (sigma-70 family)